VKLTVLPRTSAMLVIQIEADDGQYALVGVDDVLIASVSPRSPDLFVAVVVDQINKGLRLLVDKQRGIPELGAFMRRKGESESHEVTTIDVEAETLAFDFGTEAVPWSDVEYP
jgi:hypothetical protein